MDELNANGARIKITDDVLTNEEEGVDVLPVTAAGEGGSITATQSDEDAQAEYQQCEAAGTLICFRAANATLALEDATPETIARLESAFSGLADP